MSSPPARSRSRAWAQITLAASMLVILGVASASAQNLPELSYDVFYSNEILGIPTSNPSTKSATGPLKESFRYIDLMPPLPSGEVQASAVVDYGFLRLWARSLTLADDFDPLQISRDAGTRATGSFSDSVTIDAPGRTGMAGTLVANVLLDGFLDASATGQALPFTSSGSASVSLDLVMGTSGTIRVSRSCDTTVGSGAACFFGDDLGLLALGPVDFVFGQPFTLTVQANAGTFTRTVSLGTSFAESDFRFTAHWRGISDVADVQGPVPGFSVDSASGLDWAQPVPESGPAPLAATAAAALAGLAGRCRGIAGKPAGLPDRRRAPTRTPGDRRGA